MKKILIILCFLNSSLTYADQVDIMAQSRDHYLDQAISTIKSYCQSDLERRTKDAVYVCRQQLIADCAEKKGDSCDVLKKVTDLEKKVQVTDVTITQMNPRPLYSSKPLTLSAEPEKIEATKQPAPIKPQIVALNIKFGAAKPNPATEESTKAYKDLIALQKKVNGQKIRIDCAADSDCKFQEYGKKICGGPNGYFLYSNRSENMEALLKDISALTELDKLLVEKFSKDYFGTCDWSGRSEPAVCKQNTCQ